MIPDDHASGPARPTSGEIASGEMQSGSHRDSVRHDSVRHGPPVLMILAVALAVMGLLSLAAILVSAFLHWTVWPGFVLASYFCLPLAFLLMVALVVKAALGRRRS